MDTISPKATAQGRAGVCVIRIFGPRSFFNQQNAIGIAPASSWRQAAVRVGSDAEGPKSLIARWFSRLRGP